jgi:hypothetical protein
VTDLEQRLRRDLKDLSERVGPDSIRPLRVPSVRRRSRVVRWLAPVAAVAAVIGVIIGVSGVGPSGGKQPPAGHQPPPVTAQPTGPMPRYYVTAFQTFGAGLREPATFAIVRDSASGMALASVRVPTLTDSQGGTGGLSITAAGDDRTFLITQQPDLSGVIGFYLLRVAADGRSAKLSKLPLRIPGHLTVVDEALSPDGRRLALDVQNCGAKNCQYTGIRVVTLATGAVSSWTTRANGFPLNVSWVGSGQLAFEWQSGARTAPPGQQTGYRLLSLSGTGRDLLAAQAIGSPAPEPTQYVPAALVTANGSIVVTSTVQNIPDGHGRDTVVAKIIELSARTGQLLRVLYTATVRNVSGGLNGAGQLDQECNVRSLAPSGLHVLVACFMFGRVDGSHFTPLPGFPSPSSSGISGQQAGAW